MENDGSLREHIVRLLQAGQAYDTFESITGGFPADRRFVVPPAAERSAWHELEHMRIALRDILDFSRNERGDYVERAWPDDYWPQSAAPAAPDGWEPTVSAYLADRAEMEALVLAPERDLFAPFPWGDGQTLLREALLAAEHAAYHLGQVVLIERLVTAADGGVQP